MQTELTIYIYTGTCISQAKVETTSVTDGGNLWSPNAVHCIWIVKTIKQVQISGMAKAADTDRNSQVQCVVIMLYSPACRFLSVT